MGGGDRIGRWNARARRGDEWGQEASAGPRHWPKRERADLRFSALPQTRCSVRDGVLIRPRDYDPAPQPPDWFVNLSPETAAEVERGGLGLAPATRRGRQPFHFGSARARPVNCR